MALNVQMVLSENKLINEKMVVPRLVNQQTLDYDAFCDSLAQGSTVTAADVSAVMKQLEKEGLVRVEMDDQRTMLIKLL